MPKPKDSLTGVKPNCNKLPTWKFKEEPMPKPTQTKKAVTPFPLIIHNPENRQLIWRETDRAGNTIKISVVSDNKKRILCMYELPW